MDSCDMAIAILIFLLKVWFLCPLKRDYNRTLFEFPSCFLCSCESSQVNFLFPFIAFQQWLQRYGYIFIHQPLGNLCIFKELSITSNNKGRPWEIVLCFGSLNVLSKKVTKTLVLVHSSGYSKLFIFSVCSPKFRVFTPIVFYTYSIRIYTSSILPSSSLCLLCISIHSYFTQSDFATHESSISSSVTVLYIPFNILNLMWPYFAHYLHKDMILLFPPIYETILPKVIKFFFF